MQENELPEDDLQQVQRSKSKEESREERYHDRREEFHDTVKTIVLWSLYLGFGLAAGAAILLAWHYFAPPKWIWMLPEKHSCGSKHL